MRRKLTCGRCNINEIRPNHRYCLPCHASYMRTWRKTHPLTHSQRRKDRCHALSKYYVRIGTIERKPCEIKGCLNESQMHHDDYSKPLNVRWFCRPHHLQLHNDYYFNPKPSYTPAALPAVIVPAAENISCHLFL